MRAFAALAWRGLKVGSMLFGVAVAALGGASLPLIAGFWAAGTLVALLQLRYRTIAGPDRDAFAPLPREES